MKFLLLIVSLYLIPVQQDTVLICKSAGAYAYHNHQCRGLKACMHIIETVTLKEALDLHRTPCEICYLVNTLPAAPSTRCQCAAITKKGAQCSRMATAAGYCWQHGK